MELTFQECCKIVVRECPDGYARTYARAGLDLPYPPDQLPEAQRVQALYILTNMTKWHSPNAVRVRVFLKEFSKLLMTEDERTTARKCREEGKQAWLHWKDHGLCPYEKGSFQCHCWMAGYHQEVANEEQLFNQWSKP